MILKNRLLLILVAVLLAMAQAVSAAPTELNVRVADQQGKPVQGATVLLVNGTVLAAEATTNSSGWASFSLELGGEAEYLLIAEFDNVILFSNVSLSPNQTVYMILNASELFPLDVESKGLEAIEFQANLTVGGAYGIRNYTTNARFFGSNQASAAFTFPNEIRIGSERYELKNVTVEMYGAKIIAKKLLVKVEFGNESGDAYRISAEYVEASPAPPSGDLAVSASCLAVSIAALTVLTASLLKRKSLMKTLLYRRRRRVLRGG